MLLTIDAGNTRVKWALFDAHGVVQSDGACVHADLSKTTLPNCNHVIISNVAGEGVAKQLKEKLSTASSINWVQSQPQVLGITNGYDTPETLGSDRWAAIVAAWLNQQASCIVVNAGTSVTIDTVVADAQGATFIGGMILPGLTVMQKSLHNNTSQLPDFSRQIEMQRYNETVATNTKDAIQMGALSAIIGAIKNAHDALNTKTKKSAAILLSGGDASVIANHYEHVFNVESTTNPITIMNNLVLLGLFSLHNDAQSNKTNKHLKQSGTL